MANIFHIYINDCFVSCEVTVNDMDDWKYSIYFLLLRRDILDILFIEINNIIQFNCNAIPISLIEDNPNILWTVAVGYLSLVYVTQAREELVCLYLIKISVSQNWNPFAKTLTLLNWKLLALVLSGKFMSRFMQQLAPTLIRLLFNRWFFSSRRLALNTARDR